MILVGNHVKFCEKKQVCFSDKQFIKQYLLLVITYKHLVTYLVGLDNFTTFKVTHVLEKIITLMFWPYLLY